VTRAIRSPCAVVGWHVGAPRPHAAARGARRPWWRTWAIAGGSLGARPPGWVGRAPSLAGQLPLGQQLGMSLLTEMVSRGTNAVLPSGVAVWLMRNQ
jgi:hypothetical protein